MLDHGGTEQYFPVVFIVLQKVGLPFASVDETLTCDHPNESCRTVLRKAVQRFASMDEILKCDYSILRSTFM